MSESNILVVPDIVRAKAAICGDSGRAWVDALPHVVAELEALWSVQVVERLDGGTSAWVARARTTSGTPAVIKVEVPGAGFSNEVHTLELANGRGYVRLLAHHPAHHAVLLEDLGLPLSQVGYCPERQLSTLTTVLSQVWALPSRHAQEVSAWPGAPTDRAAGLSELVTRLYEELGHPCSEQVLTRALQCAERRSAAFDPDRAVVVHGDAAAANLLQVPAPRLGAENGFVFVDPNTFLGDPAYDLGVALRDWCLELLNGDAPALARRYCHLLASAGGQDETAVWQWGYLERVSTGLYAHSLTGGNQGRQHLLTAESLWNVGPDQ